MLLALLQEEALGVEVHEREEEDERRVRAELPRLPEDLLLDAALHKAVFVESDFVAAWGHFVERRLKPVE